MLLVHIHYLCPLGALLRNVGNAHFRAADSSVYIDPCAVQVHAKCVTLRGEWYATIVNA